MENASKALIIAGAILLAILIIGLGVFIYNQASNTVGETGMDQVAIRQFNGQFEPYINKTIDSTAAKALIDTVNQTEKNKVDLEGITNKKSIKTGHKYVIEPSYSNGLINKITITDQDGSTQIGDEGGVVVNPGGGDQEEPTGPDPYLEDLVEEFNSQFKPYVRGSDVTYLYPKTAVYLLGLIENSNREYDWQIQQKGDKVSEDTFSLCYAVIAEYDSTLGRIVSIYFQGRDSIPNDVM